MVILLLLFWMSISCRLSALTALFLGILRNLVLLLRARASVIDSAVKGKSQGHVVPSTIASTLVSKELVASSSDMIIVDISLGLNVGVIASPLPLKPVAITPWPSALENERSVTDGSSKKFNVLAAPIEIVLSNPVPCIFLRRWLRMLLLALMVQDMKAKKKNQVERGKKKGSKGASALPLVS
ncbi:hypothetical protein V6N13_074253 [Hibiscus sabdariffa]